MAKMAKVEVEVEVLHEALKVLRNWHEEAATEEAAVHRIGVRAILEDSWSLEEAAILLKEFAAFLY